MNNKANWKIINENFPQEKKGIKISTDEQKEITTIGIDHLSISIYSKLTKGFVCKHTLKKNKNKKSSVW